MKKIITLAVTDFKLIYRDPSLRAFLFFPIILFVLVLYFLPNWIVEYGFLKPYVSVMLMLAVIENTQMFSFINDMHKFSYEMFNIKLEVMSLKRDLVYNNETLISNRSRGSQENIKRKAQEHFFTFNGEFWADELGEYSFGLQSNCKRVDKPKEEIQ